jgi:hypothetical protein
MIDQRIIETQTTTSDAITIQSQERMIDQRIIEIQTAISDAITVTQDQLLEIIAAAQDQVLLLEAVVTEALVDLALEDSIETFVNIII